MALEKAHWEGCGGWNPCPEAPCQGASGRWPHLGHPLLALRGEAGGDESRAGRAPIGQVPEDVAFQTHSQQPGTEAARFQPSGARVAPAELVEFPEWLLGPWIARLAGPNCWNLP